MVDRQLVSRRAAFGSTGGPGRPEYRDGRRGASFHNKHFAVVAQLVERIHGKDEVRGSTPRNGSSRFYIHNDIKTVYLSVLAEHLRSQTSKHPLNYL